jgi:hypothetical protein
LLRLLDDDAGELDARADVELTEYLAQVGGDGVDTDINPVGDLLAQALGDEFGHGAFGVGQAVLSRSGPVG